jgi:hypothetical protein
METFELILKIAIGPIFLIFLGFILYLLVRELLRLSGEGEVPAFESNWGGLGRGMGGWAINRLMLFSVLALIIFLMFGGVMFQTIAVLQETKKKDETKKEETNKAQKAGGEQEGKEQHNDHSRATFDGPCSAQEQAVRNSSDEPAMNIQIVNGSEPQTTSKKRKQNGGQPSNLGCPATPPPLRNQSVDQGPEAPHKD